VSERPRWQFWPRGAGAGDHAAYRCGCGKHAVSAAAVRTRKYRAVSWHGRVWRLECALAAMADEAHAQRRVAQSVVRGGRTKAEKDRARLLDVLDAVAHECLVIAANAADPQEGPAERRAQDAANAAGEAMQMISAAHKRLALPHGSWSNAQTQDLHEKIAEVTGERDKLRAVLVQIRDRALDSRNAVTDHAEAVLTICALYCLAAGLVGTGGPKRLTRVERDGEVFYVDGIGEHGCPLCGGKYDEHGVVTKHAARCMNDATARQEDSSG
jgi:hypothetical protein